MAGVVDGWWQFKSLVPHGAQVVGAPPPEGRAVWCEKAGLRDGPFTEWWPDGEALRRQGLFVEGEQVGPWLLWHPNGKKRRMGSFRAGLESGRFVSWFDNGRTESEGSYIDGRRDGLWTWYREDRRRKHREATYAEGHPHGAWHEWHPNGQIALTRHYVHGALHGPYRTWAADGNPEVSGAYYEGLKHLRWTHYDARGAEVDEVLWQHGRCSR